MKHLVEFPLQDGGSILVEVEATEPGYDSDIELASSKEGTVVVKACKKSGALITAKYSLDQNREVFACPGHSFNEEYRGCNELIKKGAIPVTDTEDIITELEGYKNRIIPEIIYTDHSADKISKKVNIQK